MLTKILDKLTSPKSKIEDLRRREFILNILLVSAIFLLLIATFATTTKQLILNINSENAIPIWTVYLVLFSFLFLYFLSRKGFFAFSSYALILVYFLLSTYIVYLQGIEVQAPLLFFVLIIVLSGVLINSRFSFFASFIAFFTISLAFYLQEIEILRPNLNWKSDPWGWGEVIIVSIIFFIIAVVSWLSNREIEKSLKRARKSEAELKEERDSLEIRVQKRTRELQKIQMEKMAQMYKFAEFGKLSGGLFHDLINPLNAVSLNIEKIKNNKELTGQFENIEEDLERTMKATRKMKDFINSIKKQMIQKEEFESFSINEEIKDSIDILKYKIRKNNIKISFKATEEIETVGPQIKLNQVILNIINNAIDSYSNINNTDNNKKIKINLIKDNNNAIIHISDNASGIPENIIDKIFEPFFTTKDFKKNKNSGIGIGLSLSKQIIEKSFKGEIKAKNKKDGGAKFTIKFPLTKI